MYYEALSDSVGSAWLYGRLELYCPYIQTLQSFCRDSCAGYSLGVSIMFHAPEASQPSESMHIQIHFPAFFKRASCSWGSKKHHFSQIALPLYTKLIAGVKVTIIYLVSFP